MKASSAAPFVQAAKHVVEIGIDEMGDDRKAEHARHAAGALGQFWVQFRDGPIKIAALIEPQFALRRLSESYHLELLDFLSTRARSHFVTCRGPEGSDVVGDRR